MNNPKLYTKPEGRLALPQFQMFGFVLIALGGYLVYHSNWFGFISLLVGFALYFMMGGIQMDLEKRLHREYVGLLSFKFGKWTEIPELEYATIFLENYVQRGSVASIDNAFKDSKIKLNLVVNKEKIFNAGSFNSKEKALETGKLIARKLDTKLLDYTGREPKWIELG